MHKLKMLDANIEILIILFWEAGKQIIEKWKLYVPLKNRTSK
jgi:hypothetical protein